MILTTTTTNRVNVTLVERRYRAIKARRRSVGDASERGLNQTEMSSVDPRGIVRDGGPPSC